MVDNIHEDKYLDDLKRFQSRRVKDAYKRFCFEKGYNCVTDLTLYKWWKGTGVPSSTNKESVIDFFNQFEQ